MRGEDGRDATKACAGAGRSLRPMGQRRRWSEGETCLKIRLEAYGLECAQLDGAASRAKTVRKLRVEHDRS